MAVLNFAFAFLPLGAGDDEIMGPFPVFIFFTSSSSDDSTTITLFFDCETMEGRSGGGGKGGGGKGEWRRKGTI